MRWIRFSHYLVRSMNRQFVDPRFMRTYVADFGDEAIVENVVLYLNEIQLDAHGNIGDRFDGVPYMDSDRYGVGIMYSQIRYLLSKPFSQLQYVRPHVRSLLTPEFYQRCLIAIRYLNQYFDAGDAERLSRWQPRSRL